MKPKLITPPEDGPLTLEDVKAHLRVSYSDDDGYIEALMKAATAHLDGYSGILNRCIGLQTWEKYCGRFGRRMETLFTDTTAVTVKYYDTDGVQQTIDEANYRVYADFVEFARDFQFPQTEYRSDAVTLVCTSGYATPPESLLLAMKILIAHWYRNREPVTFGGIPSEMPFSVCALIAPHRWAF